MLGDSLGLVALLLQVQASTGAAFAVALLLLAGDFVPGLFGAFAGVVGDRFDLRRVMVACDLVQGVLTVAMALILPRRTNCTGAIRRRRRCTPGLASG